MNSGNFKFSVYQGDNSKIVVGTTDMLSGESIDKDYKNVRANYVFFIDNSGSMHSIIDEDDLLQRCDVTTQGMIHSLVFLNDIGLRGAKIKVWIYTFNNTLGTVCENKDVNKEFLDEFCLEQLSESGAGGGQSKIKEAFTPHGSTNMGLASKKLKELKNTTPDIISFLFSDGYHSSSEISVDMLRLDPANNIYGSKGLFNNVAMIGDDTDEAMLSIMGHVAEKALNVNGLKNLFTGWTFNAISVFCNKMKVEFEDNCMSKEELSKVDVVSSLPKEIPVVIPGQFYIWAIKNHIGELKIKVMYHKEAVDDKLIEFTTVPNLLYDSELVNAGILFSDENLKFASLDPADGTTPQKIDDMILALAPAIKITNKYLPTHFLRDAITNLTTKLEHVKSLASKEQRAYREFLTNATMDSAIPVSASAGGIMSAKSSANPRYNRYIIQSSPFENSHQLKRARFSLDHMLSAAPTNRSDPFVLCVVCRSEKPSVMVIPCGHVIACESCCPTLINSVKDVCPTCKGKIVKLKNDIKIDSRICVVCNLRGSNKIFEPCNHISTCSNCVRDHKFKSCPTCNVKITDIYDAYLP